MESSLAENVKANDGETGVILLFGFGNSNDAGIEVLSQRRSTSRTETAIGDPGRRGESVQ
jgi:hypothetical protein